MKKIFIPIFICLCLIAYVVGYSTTTTTTNLLLVKPASEDTTVDWFDTMNDNLDLIDANSPKVKLDATFAPGVTNDTDEGYIAGSIWVDVTNDKGYVCLDNTDGAAVWTETTGAGGGASQLSDLSDVGVTTPTDKYVLVADGDSWESRALVEADISDLGTAAALVADKLSAFASTTSAELAGVISDEIGAGKARFDTSVTAKTTTATLTPAEAGTVLVSAAGGAYTITLPTAVDNMGLTYHFKKTDANYFLITLDGDGTETFNYESSTGAPVLTYARLNTYCAEVTVVSDNANWQVINEAMGQVPMCSVYLSAVQSDITHNVTLYIDFDTETYDIGSNYNNSTWVSGNATSTSAGHLVDSGGAFTSAMVGKRVKNTTDTTYTYVTVYNSATDLTVRDDIFVNTEGYEIKHSKFVCPVAGDYRLTVASFLYASVTDKDYVCYGKKNNITMFFSMVHASYVGGILPMGTKIIKCSANDELTGHVKSDAGDNTADVYGVAYGTWIDVELVAKE